MIYPPSNHDVIVMLSTGAWISAYWDGAQWWAGHTSFNEDFTVANDYVISWRIKG